MTGNLFEDAKKYCEFHFMYGGGDKSADIRAGVNNLLAEYHNATQPIMCRQTLLERIKYVFDLAKSDSSHKKFYIIRKSGRHGLFSYVTIFFSHICYALAQGLIPVIDMQTLPCKYVEEESSIKNGWELFFKQPCGYTLDDVAKSGGEYFFSSIDVFPQHLTVGVQWGNEMQPFKHYDILRRLYSNFFHLNDSVVEYVNAAHEKLFPHSARILGVKCRGTDYTQPENLKYHAIQPKPENVIDYVREVMPKWTCDYIYLATEERRIYELFNNAFPGRVIKSNDMFYDDVDVDYSKTLIDEVNFDRDNDVFLRGAEYITDIILLSRCTSSVFGINNGSTAALYINDGKYENVHVFNLGVY